MKQKLKGEEITVKAKFGRELLMLLEMVRISDKKKRKSVRMPVRQASARNPK